MIGEVGGTIEWAKDKLDSFPKAKRDLGPLLDALGRKSYPSLISLFLTHNTSILFTNVEPLTQIVSGVAMLLAGVLNLVNNLLSGLGLSGLLTGILGATVKNLLFSNIGHFRTLIFLQGLDKIFIGLGLGNLFPNANKKK